MVLTDSEGAVISIGDRVKFTVLGNDNFHGNHERRILGQEGTVRHISHHYIEVDWDNVIPAGGHYGNFTMHAFRPSSLKVICPAKLIEPLDDKEVRELWY